MEKGFISSRTGGVLTYVLHSYVEWPSNRLPFLWSFQWFKLIIENRPHDDDDDTRGLNDINDIRNGFFGTTLIRSKFDKREFVILKVDAILLFP